MKEYRTAGIINDGSAAVTEKLQSLLDMAAEEHAAVIIEKGTYLTAPLFIRSSMRLVFEEDAELRAVTDESLYPLIDTRIGGISGKWYPALLNVLSANDVEISGKGILDGNGRYWWDKYWGADEKGGYRGRYDGRGLRWAADYDAMRPRNLLISDSRNITIRDITSRNPGMWNIHVLYSQDILIEGVSVDADDPHGPSTDGIDIDSSSYVTVRKCTVRTNDDSICIKSGRDADGYRIGRPCHNITVENCTLLKGFGVTIGSEVSGGVHDINIRNMAFRGTDCGFRIKSARPRRGYIRNVIVSNLEMEDVRYPVHICLDWNPAYSYCSLPEGYAGDIPEMWKKLLERIPGEVPLTSVENLLIKNVAARISGKTESRAFNIEGYEENPIRNLVMENISIEASEFGVISAVNDLSMNSVKLSVRGSNDSRNDGYDNR